MATEATVASVATRRSVEPPEIIGYTTRNQRGRGRWGGDTSCDPPEQKVPSSVGRRQKPGSRSIVREVYIERGSSALETHLSRNSASSNICNNYEESINVRERPAIPSNAPRNQGRTHRKEKESDVEMLGGYSHRSRDKFADACLQSTQTGGRSNASIGGASTEPHWRDRRVGSVCSEQSKSSIVSRGKQNHSYIQTNSALLAVVSGVVILFTLVVYGTGGLGDGGGIDAQRTLGDMSEPAKEMIDNVQLDARSPGAVSTDGESEEVDPMQLNDVNIDAVGDTTDQKHGPPLLRGHDSNLTKDKGAQGQPQPQPQPQQQEQRNPQPQQPLRHKMEGETPQVQEAIKTQPVDEQLPTSELEVHSVEKEVNAERTESNAGTGDQSGQQKMLKVDPKVKELATQRLQAANQREQAAQELLKVSDASPKTGEQGDEVGGPPDAQKLGRKDPTEAKLP